MKFPPLLRNGADAEPKTDPGVLVTMGRHKRDMRRTTLTALVMVMLGAASPAIMDLGTRLLGQKGRLDKVEERVDALGLDMRSLYQAIVTGRRQERLESDGGTP